MGPGERVGRWLGCARLQGFSLAAYVLLVLGRAAPSLGRTEVPRPASWFMLDAALPTLQACRVWRRRALPRRRQADRRRSEAPRPGRCRAGWPPALLAARLARGHVGPQPGLRLRHPAAAS